MPSKFDPGTDSDLVLTQVGNNVDHLRACNIGIQFIYTCLQRTSGNNIKLVYLIYPIRTYSLLTIFEVQQMFINWKIATLFINREKERK